jgi:hypothetical protein
MWILEVSIMPRFHAFKIRRALAIGLAVGWYLMVPSLDNTDLPLSKWYHYSSHETADECGQHLAVASALMQHQLEQAEKQHDNRSTQTLEREASALRDAQCIASDDPRLAR